MGFSNEHYKDIIDSAKAELEKWNAAPEDFKKRSIEMGMDLGRWYASMIEACEQSIEPENDDITQALETALNKQQTKPEEQSNDYPDPLDVGGLIHNSTAKKRNVIMRDWLEHNFNNDGFDLPKALFNRIHDSVNKLTGVNKDPEDEAAFIDALNKEFKNDFASSNKHFGEGQAEGLDNLLEGLRDTPHDNRW